MASRDKQKETIKPATRGNTNATPGPSRSRDTALPQGMRDAGPSSYQRSRVDDLTTPQPLRDTETPSGSRDAGPSSYRRSRADDLTTPRPPRDTETPLGSRDAGPSGTRHPRADDYQTPITNRDTVEPRGPRDAGPTSNQRSRVDDTPRQVFRQYKTPAPESTPKRRPEIGVDALLTDTMINYERRYGKRPATFAPSRATSREAITPTPTTAPTIPSDDESMGLPRRKPYTHSRCCKGF